MAKGLTRIVFRNPMVASIFSFPTMAVSPSLSFKDIIIYLIAQATLILLPTNGFKYDKFHLFSYDKDKELVLIFKVSIAAN